MGVPIEVVDRLRRATEAARAVECQRGEGRIVPGTSLTVTVTSGGFEDASAPMCMRVEDFSAGGMGLLYSESVSVGSTMLLDLPDLDGQRVLVHSTVCSCHAVADRIYRIGVRFEHVES